jgi:hypothetical protein
MEGSMHVFGLLFCLLSLPVIAASELITQIHDIDYGFRSEDEVLIFLTSGDVAKLRPSSAHLSKKIIIKKNWYKITMDRDRFITKIEPTILPRPKIETNEVLPTLLQEYVPTTVASMSVARSLFREARYNPKESQCFNRAMVWTYEWWKKHSVRSNKILIFFTRNYIRRYNFEWWFHIAPYVHIMDEGKVIERVMDRKYTNGPLAFDSWTKIFMRNDASCTVITKYSEYADYPYAGDCKILRTHMYTYQPADLQMYEAWGYTKENFNIDEVRSAYLEAFDENL